MRVVVGSDHAGFEQKERLAQHLRDTGYEVIDVGTNDEESVDYPDFAIAAARKVAAGEADLGVLVCGTGLGMAIAANKVRGVRAVQVNDVAFAEMSRRHNDANVVTLAGRSIGEDAAFAIVDAFLGTAFEGGRHQNRIDQISAMECKP